LRKSILNLIILRVIVYLTDKKIIEFQTDVDISKKSYHNCDKNKLVE